MTDAGVLDDAVQLRRAFTLYPHGVMAVAAPLVWHDSTFLSVTPLS